jgi:tetratricopeptide (TPR) repeat protein
MPDASSEFHAVQIDAGLAAREAQRHFESGRFTEAIRLFQKALDSCPTNPEWHYRLGFAAWRAGDRDSAGRHFLETARLAPHHPAGHQALADWCRNVGDLSGALRHSERAIVIAPDEPDVMTSRAWALADAGQTEDAWGFIERLNSRGVCSPRLAALCGQIAPELGKEKTALDLLLTVSTTPNLSDSDRRQTHFAISLVMDRLGRYDEAFSYATSAHAANRRPYDRHFMRKLVDRRIQYYTPRKLHDLPRASHGSRRPIFILGMPRSGTSLIEQILASHGQVHGAGELTLIRETALAIAAADPESHEFPECLDGLPLRACNQRAETLLSAVTSLNPAAHFIIDKMPQNYLYMGVIATLFPDCHVIHCIRDPMDTCLSCYLTHFTVGHEFAEDLKAVGEYYVQYRRLMAHWREALHYPMIEVRYEDVVSDLEGQTRRLLELLDLPWDPNCLEFHKTRRYVTTASTHQVRRPLYANSVGRWRNYEKHLSPLRDALSQGLAGLVSKSSNDLNVPARQTAPKQV